MLDKRLSTYLLLLVLCLAVPVLPLHAAPPQHPVRLAGAVNVVYGSPDGLSILVIEGYEWWPGGGVYGWSQDTGGVQGMCKLEDHFGMALAIGDFRGYRIFMPLVFH